MRWSRYFLPTSKNNPAEAQIVSHRYMLRSGLMRQETSGIYSWLPMGLKVLQNIVKIVKREHDKAGCIELLMPVMQPAELWIKSGRYDAYGKEMLRISDRHERELVFSPTNEEMITDIFRTYHKSYRDIPKILYQMQWKFRDEIRPRFGVMRGREFFMKDAYSFDLNYEDAVKSYNLMFDVYLKTFKAMGLRVIPVQANSGPIGGDLTHEFHVLASTGESALFYDKAFEDYFKSDEPLTREKLLSMYAASDEKHDPEKCPIPADQIMQARGIEVGHIFYYGTKYSDVMDVKVTSQQGTLTPVYSGCYGIGLSRLVGAIIEASHDDVGIVWPLEVAPFQIGLVNLKVGDAEFEEKTEQLYEGLQAMNYDVLYDDRDQSPGSKLADMDLIGLPYHVILGPKSMAKGNVEIKNRKTHERVEVPFDQVLSWIKERVQL
jgi:prolyl-tRNA synthetase